VLRIAAPGSVIPALDKKAAWAEHLKVATLASPGLWSSVRFQMTRPGPLSFTVFGITGLYHRFSGGTA
jgi:hypothetical protein